jgi:hypothetical protein
MFAEMYGKASVDVSAVWQWERPIEEAESGGEDLDAKLQSGHPCTAAVPDNIW